MNKVLFLPQGYEAPKSSGFYMKLQDGDNKFRILSSPIIGWEDWLDKKPIRFRFNDKPAKPVDAKKPVKHFWSMIVWNYQEEEIQILHLTQASIRNSIEALCSDEDWGAPYFYDIKIIRKGEALETEYTVNPVPHKKLGDHVIEKFKERPCNLDALFDCADPFAKDQPNYTKGVFTSDADGVFSVGLSDIQIEDLTNIIGDCDKPYQELLMQSIKREFNANSIKEIPLDQFDRVKTAATKYMERTISKQQEASK